MCATECELCCLLFGCCCSRRQDRLGIKTKLFQIFNNKIVFQTYLVNFRPLFQFASELFISSTVVWCTPKALSFSRASQIDAMHQGTRNTFSSSKQVNTQKPF